MHSWSRFVANRFIIITPWKKKMLHCPYSDTTSRMVLMQHKHSQYTEIPRNRIKWDGKKGHFCWIHHSCFCPLTFFCLKRSIRRPDVCSSFAWTKQNERTPKRICMRNIRCGDNVATFKRRGNESTIYVNAMCFLRQYRRHVHFEFSPIFELIQFELRSQRSGHSPCVCFSLSFSCTNFVFLSLSVSHSPNS